MPKIRNVVVVSAWWESDKRDFEVPYRLYAELKNKLKMFLGDKEQLLTLIASNQKLIG